jgi:hypothetical protein
MTARILKDTEIADLAKGLLDGGPVELPRDVNHDDTIDRLIGWAPGLQEVHIAEDTVEDGIILMP